MISWEKRIAVAVLCVTILFVAVVRMRLLSVPLERDEGEYAYAGQLILQGVPPYQHVYNMKLPGIYAMYALVLAVFGQTQEGIHLGLLAVNITSIVFVYILGKRLFNCSVGALSAAVFGLMSLAQNTHGFVANAEHFVVLFVLAGCWLLLRAMASGRILTLAGAGVLLGLTFVIKQHGAAFMALGGLTWVIFQLTRKPYHWKRLAGTTVLLFFSMAVPFGITCMIMKWVGVFDKFWFWTVDYARTYSSLVPLKQAWQSFIRTADYINGFNQLLWLTAAIGLLMLIFRKTAATTRYFMLGLCGFSFLAICPGFYFRPHYFLFLLPATALLAGNALFRLWTLFDSYRAFVIRRLVPTVLILGIFALSVYPQRDYLFRWTPFQISRSAYGTNPFPESLLVARYLKKHSSNTDTIAVIGSEPQIYFYSRRRSATGYIYMYPLMEKHNFAQTMQQEMIREIEKSSPKYLVLVTCSSSWLVSRDSKDDLFKWMASYGRHYHCVGVVEVHPKETPCEMWGPNAEKYIPRTRSYIRVFQRNLVAN